MKAHGLITILTAATLFGLGAQAQVSTFPSPPSLAPAPDRAPAAVTNAPPQLSLDPNPGDPTRPSTKVPAGTDTNTPSANPVTAATLTTMTALDDKVSLNAGDTISFRVIEDRDEPVTRIVTDTGEIDFPYIGRVKVAGKTCHEVAVEVKKLLEVDYYKHATVIVGLDLIAGKDKTIPKDLVWVVGEVKDVGPLELIKAQTMTVSQIILRAGGFGDFADQRKVKLIHRGAKATAENQAPDLSNIKDGEMIDVKSVFDGKSNADPVVRAGDYIIVPKKIFNL